MKFCTNCGESLEEDAQVCPKCGTPVGAANATPNPAPSAAPNMQQPTQPYAAAPGYQPVYVVDPTDHTAEMDPADIAENKILAIAIYVLSWAGMLIALLAARDSKFVGFHLREVLRLLVLESLVAIVALVLCWTIIVPIVAGVFGIVLFVVQIIGFVNACNGKAKELPIIHAFKFL
jgi:uncharacterized membrane protein